MQNIGDKISKLSKLFDLKKITKIRPDKNYIQDYYKTNKIPYSVFHSKDNLIHMGVSSGRQFKKTDLNYFSEQISSFIKTQHSKVVLELGSGRGANSYYLAKKFPKSTFIGIDLSEAQLEFAKDYAALVDNLKFLKGDYHNLSAIKDNSIDLCFTIEAFCYATEPRIVLKEIHRVLKNNGLFYIADGYLRKKKKTLIYEEKVAKRLVEVGMAVEDIKQYDELHSLIKTSGFRELYTEDVSTGILPTLERFERLAGVYLHLGPITRILNKFLPKKFVYNLFSGYLLKSAIQSGLASYMINIYTKK